MKCLMVLVLALYLALGPAVAQITFSRSWVPQGKRSGPLVAPGGSTDATDSCHDARLAALTQVAAHIYVSIDTAGGSRRGLSKLTDI